MVLRAGKPNSTAVPGPAHGGLPATPSPAHILTAALECVNQNDRHIVCSKQRVESHRAVVSHVMPVRLSTIASQQLDGGAGCAASQKAGERVAVFFATAPHMQ